MSGAQAKAIEIAGGIGVIAEVDESRIKTRFDQGWVSRISDDLEEIFEWVDEAKKSERVLSIAYHGNVVNLWKYVVDNDIKVELSSDQTSCHAVYEGGYTPFQISFKEGRTLIKNNISKFKQLVDMRIQKKTHNIMLLEYVLVLRPCFLIKDLLQCILKIHILCKSS